MNFQCDAVTFCVIVAVLFLHQILWDQKLRLEYLSLLAYPGFSWGNCAILCNLLFFSKTEQKRKNCDQKSTYIIEEEEGARDEYEDQCKGHRPVST